MPLEARLRENVFGAMRNLTISGLVEHTPRGKGKEGRFSEVMVLGNPHIVGKFPPNPACQDAVLKLSRQTLSISRGEGKNYIYCHLTAILVPVSHVVYKHMPSHSPEFQNRHNRHDVFRCAKT